MLKLQNMRILSVVEIMSTVIFVFLIETLNPDYWRLSWEDVNIPWWTCKAARHWPLGSPIGNSCKNKVPCLKLEKGIGLTHYRFAMDSLSNRLDEGMEVWIDLISWKMQCGVPWRCADEAQMQWPTIIRTQMKHHLFLVYIVYHKFWLPHTPSTLHLPRHSL